MHGEQTTASYRPKNKLFRPGKLIRENLNVIDCWRPITISSILIAHKAQLKRMGAEYKLRSQQAAMILSDADRNISITKTTMFMVFMDIQAAFDMLDHTAVKTILTETGCPNRERVVEYVLSSYTGSTTRLLCNGGRPFLHPF